ncbi:BNR-4 repeat-containing protein [Algibacillus agarilyticus]|uniref:BNR-4 repeat-containing protein n=1 Tax=Algibacillus agarilyticus TaxID=2234133 RepID=UPI000DD04DC9|nr:BNR-4 repeat-containing protein [Algibacillus agarilyticus]
MNTILNKKIKRSASALSVILSLVSAQALAEVELEQEIHITDLGLYFNGDKKSSTNAALNEADVGPGQYDYMYGRAITPHGDTIKVYKNFVFMTWYKGGKYNRHVQLTRYNMDTGTTKTIEFPHRHTGYQNRWWVGETHNTIAIGLSPKNESIHMVFDQHSLSSSNPSDGTAANDYFKYYYSKANALTVPDNEFTLDLFVKDTYFAGNDLVNAKYSPSDEIDEYKHITLTGDVNSNIFANLSYPKFFTTNEGDLFLYMRKGRSQNGKFSYIRYDGNNWQSSFKDFNHNGAQSRGNAYNYGVYGEMKYLNGKVRMGFQQRAKVDDKYVYQNGFFGAYSDDPIGQTNWKNYNHESLTMPVLNTDAIKISEPGDVFPAANSRNQLYMVGGFDWTVTDNDDVHFIGSVKDTRNNITKKVHTYRKGGNSDFVTTTDFSGADELYTAGNDIFIIGLQGGRPNIERAVGGTNNFEVVYRPTTGKIFEKGVPYIHEGKLYYYLLESGSGDKRTTYLQIIDLDLVDISGPDGFSFAANEGDTVEVTGTMDIAFGANGQFNYLNAQTNNVYCERNIFGDPAPGVVKKCYVKAVVDQTPEVSFDQGEIVLDEGYEQLLLSVQVDSPTDADIEHVKLYLNGDFIRQESVPPYEWGHAGLPNELLGFTAGRYTFKAVATDVNGNEGQKYKIVNVNEVENSNGCSSTTDVTWNSKTEVTLSASDSCIRFDRDLSGATVQFWDSDTNTACDFNGSVFSVDGSGTIDISATYKQSSDFSGSILMLAPSNNCQFIKVRAY